MNFFFPQHNAKNIWRKNEKNIFQITCVKTKILLFEVVKKCSKKGKEQSNEGEDAQRIRK